MDKKRPRLFWKEAQDVDGHWEAGLAPQEGSSPRWGGETREERRVVLRAGLGAQRAEAPQHSARGAGPGSDGLSLGARQVLARMLSGGLIVPRPAEDGWACSRSWLGSGPRTPVVSHIFHEMQRAPILSKTW